MVDIFPPAFLTAVVPWAVWKFPALKDVLGLDGTADGRGVGFNAGEGGGGGVDAAGFDA
ncbi:MAG: hypothetical protein ACD_37C00354G0001 [uncultured bacterium]|nr:MAG: hypothetical protein ACD_37C00354G0001 [uncultured bacterium]